VMRAFLAYVKSTMNQLQHSLYGDA
jgi:hypothetical protein